MLPLFRPSQDEPGGHDACGWWSSGGLLSSAECPRFHHRACAHKVSRILNLALMYKYWSCLICENECIVLIFHWFHFIELWVWRLTARQVTASFQKQRLLFYVVRICTWRIIAMDVQVCERNALWTFQHTCDIYIHVLPSLWRYISRLETAHGHDNLIPVSHMCAKLLVSVLKPLIFCFKQRAVLRGLHERTGFTWLLIHSPLLNIMGSHHTSFLAQTIKK